MANEWFKFKKFIIFQDKCAMKVGTDGVILGAWTRVLGYKKGLDIGTGTGLLALMLAQRSPLLQMDAIDIDRKAAAQANENCKGSIYKEQIKVFNEDFRRFGNKKSARYNLIVCNPPYFIDSLKPDDPERSIARHAETFDLKILIERASKLLLPGGNLSIILPSEFKELMIILAKGQNLYLNRLLNVIPVPDKETKRVCMEFSFSQGNREIKSLIIESGGRHNYSQAYKSLTKDFYLDF